MCWNIAYMLRIDAFGSASFFAQLTSVQGSVTDRVYRAIAAANPPEISKSGSYNQGPSEGILRSLMQIETSIKVESGA